MRDTDDDKDACPMPHARVLHPTSKELSEWVDIFKLPIPHPENDVVWAIERNYWSERIILVILSIGFVAFFCITLNMFLGNKSAFVIPLILTFVGVTIGLTRMVWRALMRYALIFTEHEAYRCVEVMGFRKVNRFAYDQIAGVDRVKSKWGIFLSGEWTLYDVVVRLKNGERYYLTWNDDGSEEEVDWLIASIRKIGNISVT